MHRIASQYLSTQLDAGMSPPADTAPDFVYEAEMGFARGELLAGLPAAIAPFRIESHCVESSDELHRVESRDGESNDDGLRELRNNESRAMVYQLRHDTRRVRLTLYAERIRSIGAIRVPVSAVKLEFFNFDEVRYERFMARYKRHLHKGGG